MPSLWYPLPSNSPSSICVVCEDRTCPFASCFLGVDVAGMSPFVCTLHSWLLPLWIADTDDHLSRSPWSLSSSLPDPLMGSTAACAISADSASKSDSTTQGEGVRKSSAVSQDIMEFWLSLLHPVPLSSSRLLFRSRSTKAWMTTSPSLLMSK